MATRTATLYQGEDMAPALDYTDLMIWEESEFGTRAWQGEGSASSIVIRDPLGEQGSALSLPAGLTSKSLAAKNLFVVKVGSDYLFRGRVGIKNYSRDSQYVERYRQVECSLHDTNWDLDHIFVHDWTRGTENDQQRVQGLIASYLSGSPRPTTALNGSNYISSSNTVTLPEQTYTRSSPLQILREIATTANKQFFVTGDTIGGGSLFYDGNDSTAYASTLSISDRQSEVNYTSVFPPIWNVGPASTEDGSEMLCEVIYFYGTGGDQYVRVHSDTVHTQYGHASATISDDTAETATVATARANAILAHRRYEDRTYNVTIGPLTDAQVVLIEHGQTIPIKARAIPDADDAYRTMRIVQCRYTTPVVGTWFAHLQLGRPWKMQPYSVGTPATKGDIPQSAAECEGLCLETYTRSVDPGWGVAEINGSTYTSNAIYNVNGNEGGARQTANAGPTPAYLPIVASTPFEILIKRKIIKHVEPSPSTGSYIDVWNVVNNTGSYLDAAGVVLSWEVVSGDISVRMRGTTSFTPLGVILSAYTSGTWFWMRFRVEAASLKVKTWYDGSAEPGAWSATLGTGAISPPTYLGWAVHTYHADADMEFRDDWYQVVEGMDCGDCSTPGTVVGTGEGAFGEGPGYLPPGSSLEHGYITSGGPYHTFDDIGNPMTAVGDLIRGDTAGAATRLPIGGSNFILKSDGSVPSWSDTASLSYLDVADHVPPSPPSPSSGVRIYGSNSKGYYKSPSGTVVELGGAGGGGGGGSPLTVQDEGTPLSSDATTLNFVGSGVVASGAGATKTITVAGAGRSISRTQSIIQDDCFYTGTTGYVGGFGQSVSGTGASFTVGTGEANHPGVIILNTGSTSTGRVAFFQFSSALLSIVLGGGEVSYGIVLKLDTLSTGTETYIIRMGLGDSVTGEYTDGVFFRYTDGVNGGNWEIVARANNVETAADSGVAADTSWHTFEAVINAAGTSAEFFIDGASVGTVASNIPTGAGREVVAHGAAVIKSVGSTNRTVRMDAYWYHFDFTTPR